MLNIDEQKLMDLLDKRRTNIDNNPASGISTLISGVSMFVTLVLSKSHLSFFVAGAYLVAVIISVYGICDIYRCVAKKYNSKMLCNEIISLDDKHSRTEYIIVVKNKSNNKYLLTYNSRWKCYLFPSVNKERMAKETAGGSSIEEALSLIAFNTLGLSKGVIFSEVGQLKEYKMNYADKLYTNYDFKFYIAYIDENVNKRKVENRRFIWRSMDKILKNRNIENKNKNVVEYVNNNTGLSE